MFCQFCHIVGGAFEGVEFDGFGSGSLAIAHHVGDDDAEVHGEEDGNLVAPAKAEVGPAVNAEDGSPGRRGRRCKEVMVALAVKDGMVVLNSRVGWCELVWSHGEDNQVMGFGKQQYICKNRIEKKGKKKGRTKDGEIEGIYTWLSSSMPRSMVRT